MIHRPIKPDAGAAGAGAGADADDEDWQPALENDKMKG